MNTCSICSKTDDPTVVQGIKPQMSYGWSTVTLHEFGSAIRNFILCRSCTNVVDAVLTR